MAVELSEKELADLRAKADAADKREAELAELGKKHSEAEARGTALQKKYDDDMRQVAAYLQQQNQPPPAKEDDEDPDAIVSRKDLRKASEESARRAAEASAQQARFVLDNQRQIYKQMARERLKDFDKYEAEIDAHIAQLPLDKAATATAYQEVYKYVAGGHALREREEAARIARESEGEEAESDNSSPVASSYSRPISRSEVASPTSSATASRAISRASQVKPRLTDEERRVAEGFGMSAEDYAGKWATDDEMTNNDFMGFRDKEGHVRKRV